MRFMCLFVLMLSVVACGERQTGLAPVVELRWHPQNNHQTAHRVQRGETLYAIAFRYDKDFRQLAAYNHLRSPYSLRVGQVVRLPGSSSVVINKTWHSAQQRPPIKAGPASKGIQPRVISRSGSWYWPAKGRVVSSFVPQQGKKGIDIAGKKGDKVYASAGGIVAYAGNGLSGYGNLIIIKHNGQFLTAYGNNSRNRVREGQLVKAGQVIADMGVMDRKFWGVHFEIRKSGQPVNPVSYLR